MDEEPELVPEMWEKDEPVRVALSRPMTGQCR
eukprot:CAMPEP_0206619590 /NCGR_PEP_ID=MMETSP0325_2-20121206/60975_1 /ASSEMBLY_ACC=CAM_ASM_000347 /TAXON_ID=2866 /ORGANISM="Crypthecodinium cohnii, Strain Seligo" /LENGTH=31 /DNA_ID= /DNA_START= /DNA_END= /DNA_ORIENTATION=